MIYKIIKPPSSLAGFVRAFWILEGGMNSSDVTSYRLMADNSPNLVFHYVNNFSILTDGKYTASSGISFLHGQSNLSMDMNTKGTFGILGAYLYPYALQYLFNIPAIELTGLEVELETILARYSKTLDDKILNAADNSGRISLLTDFLLSRLKDAQIKDKGIEHGVKQILRSNGNTRIEAIAGTIGISNRQLERKFTNHVGMSPKMFSRICRFQNSMKAAEIHMADNSNLSLTKLAYDCGYSDQSHFIREFREFSGMNPRDYFHNIPDSVDNFAVLS